VKYAWIDEQKGLYPLKYLCSALSVSASNYTSWKRGGRCRRLGNDVQLLASIRAIHAEFKGAYGWPRMVREIKDRGIPAGKGRVRLLMKKHGIKARHKRKYKATTTSARPAGATEPAGAGLCHAAV
jgi:putative transposase